jgi:hypothetical protein
VIGRSEVIEYRAAAMLQAVEDVMELAHVERVGERLCGRGIADRDEGVVNEAVFDAVS